MERVIRNRILIFLVVAAILSLILIKATGRQPVAKINAVLPTRQNIVASISSNGKGEPISPFVMRAQLDTFVEKIRVTEGQAVKKGQPLLELNVKDAAAQAAGALATAIAQRDRLQRSHEALIRLIAEHAATKDELSANDLELT